jgi:hypothetical protein
MHVSSERKLRILILYGEFSRLRMGVTLHTSSNGHFIRATQISGIPRVYGRVTRKLLVRLGRVPTSKIPETNMYGREPGLVSLLAILRLQYAWSKQYNRYSKEGYR